MLTHWMALLLAAHSALALDQVHPKDEKAVAAIASRSLPYVKEFLELYPDAKVKMYFPDSVQYTAHTEADVLETFYLRATVGLYSRYTLTMGIRFKMSPDQKTVTSFKEPVFHMQEVQSVKITPIEGYPGGQAHIHSTTFLSEFKYDKFKTLKAHKGDFSAIGVTARTDAPIENFDRVWKPEK